MTGHGRLDRQLLQTYLSDHIGGAAAVRNRVARMAKRYDDPDLSTTMERLAVELTVEREWLLRLARRHDLGTSGWKSAGTWVAERVARLKPDGRPVDSPLSPLLELEILGGGLRGKRSIWLTLLEWAPDLDVDTADLEGFLVDVDRQIDDVEHLLAKVRPTALSQNG